jgi:hypothetical protein
MRHRPQGVIVFPDILVPGIVCATLKLGLDAGNGPEFVFHKNKDNTPFCPIGASWVVSDPTAVAEAMVMLLRRQVAGLPAETPRLDYTHELSAKKTSI